MSLLLAALLLQPALLISDPSGGHSEVPEPILEAAQAQDETTDAVRAAVKAAPRRTKVGRIRGLRATSSVRFLATPDDPYEMSASFGFPERSRVVLSSGGGSFERYQLGTTLLARDVVKDAPGGAPRSLVLRGKGRKETLLDMELRRALFLWPDAPLFEGKGTTYVAKVDTIGVLLATVDEATGLPSRIVALGEDGKAGAEFHSVVWGDAETAGSRRWPTSFTFAVGGQDIWQETVRGVQDTWRFSDLWFLPSDRLAALMGSKTKGKLRLRALSGAWVYRVPVKSPPRGDGDESTARGLVDVADAAAAGWNEFRGVVQASFPEGSSVFVSPYVDLTLNEEGRPIAWEYEAQTPEQNRPIGEGWRWRSPKNYWAYPLTREAASAGSDGQSLELEGALKAIASVPDQGSASASSPGARFRVGEDILNGAARSVGIELELTAETTQGSSESPDGPDSSDGASAKKPESKRSD